MNDYRLVYTKETSYRDAEPYRDIDAFIIRNLSFHRNCFVSAKTYKKIKYQLDEYFGEKVIVAVPSMYGGYILRFRMR